MNLPKRRSGDKGGHHPGPFGVRVSIDNLCGVESADLAASIYLQTKPPPELDVISENRIDQLDRATGRPARDLPKNTSPIPPAPRRPIRMNAHGGGANRHDSLRGIDRGGGLDADFKLLAMHVMPGDVLSLHRLEMFPPPPAA